MRRFSRGRLRLRLKGGQLLLEAVDIKPPVNAKPLYIEKMAEV
jgi:hypothetical protein